MKRVSGCWRGCEVRLFIEELSTSQLNIFPFTQISHLILFFVSLLRPIVRPLLLPAPTGSALALQLEKHSWTATALALPLLGCGLQYVVQRFAAPGRADCEAKAFEKTLTTLFIKTLVRSCTKKPKKAGVPTTSARVNLVGKGERSIAKRAKLPRGFRARDKDW